MSQTPNKQEADGLPALDFLCRARSRSASALAFEFARHCHYQQASQPWSMAEQEREPEKYHAFLTEGGRAKLACSTARSKLAPAIDNQIKEHGGAGWLPLGHGERAQPYRHDWVISHRGRLNLSFSEFDRRLSASGIFSASGWEQPRAPNFGVRHIFG